MKTIYMGVTIDLINQQQLQDQIDYINASNPELRETKDGIKYLVIPEPK